MIFIERWHNFIIYKYIYQYIQKGGKNSKAINLFFFLLPKDEIVRIKTKNSPKKNLKLIINRFSFFFNDLLPSQSNYYYSELENQSIISYTKHSFYFLLVTKKGEKLNDHGYHKEARKRLLKKQITQL